MAARHEAQAGAAAAARTGPERTEAPDTLEQAAQNVRDGLGPGAIAWETTFRRHAGPEGTTLYVHAETGEVYDHLPRLNQKDGNPEG